MSPTNEVRVYAYVNHPYERVAPKLREGLAGLVRSATTSAATRAKGLVSTMHASIGGIEVAADVVVTVESVSDNERTSLGPVTRVVLAWKAAEHPALFPTMQATLSVYPLAPGETQLDFSGEYLPPLGILGAGFNALIGHRIADACVHRFVEDLNEQLRLAAA